MKKKIITVSVMVLTLALVFSACGNKGYVKYTEENGNEHVLLTDAEGNTMVDEAGMLVAGVTDERGNLVTDANGEYEKAGVNYPDVIAQGSTYETKSFKLALPSKEWGIDNNRIVRLGTEAYIDVTAIDGEGKSVEQYFDEQVLSTDKLKGQSDGKIDFTSTTMTLASAEKTAYVIDSSFYNDDGAVSEYRVVYYFESGDYIYKMLCITPAGSADKAVFNDVMNMIIFK